MKLILLSIFFSPSNIIGDYFTIEFLEKCLKNFKRRYDFLQRKNNQIIFKRIKKNMTYCLNNIALMAYHFCWHWQSRV